MVDVLEMLKWDIEGNAPPEGSPKICTEPPTPPLAGVMGDVENLLHEQRDRINALVESIRGMIF
jgi:hypothetical protein